MIYYDTPLRIGYRAYRMFIRMQRSDAERFTIPSHESWSAKIQPGNFPKESSACIDPEKPRIFSD